MTHDELESYINNFNEHQRENVYKQIIDCELLRKAFETPDGKNILNSAVDLISANVMKIVVECKGVGDSEKIFSAAREINTTYKLMSDWAKILIRGGEHREKAEKIN